MALKSVRVPPALAPPFEHAEERVTQHFDTLTRNPERGVIKVAGERYVLMRCESLFLGWMDAMSDSFGEKAAREFIYNTAREIGRADSAAYSERHSLIDGIDRLASGPIHFSFAGWAFVEILADSAPSNDDTYFLHYLHPNTFESDVIQSKGRSVELPSCLFSAGYSAGWCSKAFGVEVHGREVRCVSLGDESCEFVMAPESQLDTHETRVLTT